MDGLCFTEVQIRTHDGRKVPVRGIKQIDVLLRHRMADQQRNQVASTNAIRGQKRWQFGKYLAREGIPTQMRVVIRYHDSVRRHNGLAQFPLACRTRIESPNRAWKSLQIVRRSWQAVTAYQFRARHQDVAITQDLAGHHRFVSNGANPQCDVDAVFKRIDPTFGCVHVDETDRRGKSAVSAREPWNRDADAKPRHH